MMRSAFVPIVLGIALSACVAPQYADHPAVPPIPPEQVYAPPPSRIALIWQPGHWDWNGASYSWAPGAWVERAGHGTLWQDGFWQPGPDGSRWVPGHWL